MEDKIRVEDRRLSIKSIPTKNELDQLLKKLDTQLRLLSGRRITCIQRNKSS